MRNWHFSSFYFFYFVSVGVFVPYWSLHLKYLDFNATEIGQLMGIFLLTKVVAPNIWATLADHVASEKGHSLGLLKFAAFAAFAFYCLMFWANSFWYIGAVMAAYCLFFNAWLPQLEAATLNHLKSQARDKVDQDSSGHHYGSIRLWGSIGFILTVLTLGALIDSYGPAIILPAGAISLLSIVIVSFWMKGGAAELTPESRVKIPIRQLLNIKIILLLSLCVAMQISHAPFYTFFSIYLESYGYSKTYIGILWSVGVVFEIGIFLIGYRLLRYYRLAHLLSFTFAIASARWFMLAQYPENGVILFFSQVLHAITYGLYHSIMIQFIDRFFKGRYQIRGQALYTSVSFGLGGAAGSVISGYVWSGFGGNYLFLCAGVLMFAVTIISLFITPRITVIAANTSNDTSEVSNKGNSY